MIYDDMGTSQQGKKLKLKLTKKQGMQDSQVLQNLTESMFKQNLEPTKNPINQIELNNQLKRSRLDSFYESRIIDSDDFHQYTYRQANKSNEKQAYSVTQSQFLGDRVTFGTVRNEDDNKLFMIPKQVNQFIEQFSEKNDDFIRHILFQKEKIEKDIEYLADEIMVILNQKKKQMLEQMDNYLTRFTNNYQILQDKIQEFKAYFTQSQNLTYQIPINIQSLSFYCQDDQTEKVTKIKEEKCTIRQKLSDVDAEISKRAMIFMTEQFDEHIKHKPCYSENSTHQIFFQNLRGEIENMLIDKLQRMDDMFNQSRLYNFDKLIVLPKVETIISDQKQNAMGGDRDLQELEALKSIINQKLNSQKTRMNFSLGLGQGMKNLGLKLQGKYFCDSQVYCIVAINDDLIATGSKDGGLLIWKLSENKVINIIQTKQAITQLKVFKGIVSDFNLQTNIKASFLAGRIANKEEYYLMTGNQDIRIWDYKTGGLMRQIRGQKGMITCLFSLRDMHSIVSGNDQGQLTFWNAYSGLAMKKITDHKDIIHSIVQSKEGRLITCSSDRQIIIYNLQYVSSQIYSRQVFGDCIREKILVDDSQIYTIQSSMIEEHLLISGGSDSKIKIWNLKTGKNEEIVGHKCPIADIVMLENPLDIDTQKMFAMISVSTGDDVLRLSTSISPLNSGIYLEEKILNEFGATCRPLLQLIQDPIEKTLRLVVLSQDEQNKYFLVLKLL